MPAIQSGLKSPLYASSKRTWAQKSNVQSRITAQPRFQGRLLQWNPEEGAEEKEALKPQKSTGQGSKEGHTLIGQIQSLMTSLIGLLPPRALHALEHKNLFAGHYMPELKVSLTEVKKQHPHLKEMLAQIEEVSFQSSHYPDVRNYGWFIPPKGGKPTILHAMGNKSSLVSILRYQPLVDEGYGFMAYEYPGYGSTPGKPSELALYQSAFMASEFLQQVKRIPVEDQVFHGISLGGAVTAELAHRVGRNKAVILESTMTSFPDVARRKVENYAPAWLAPLHKLTFSQMQSIEKMPAIKAPLLVLHGDKDTLMPRHFAHQLWERAGTPLPQKKLITFRDQGHNIDTGHSVPAIRQFLKELTHSPQSSGN
jgi:alpha-beta hydrolase superfamily lysophospholipase